jgi:hypothetical protein
MVLHGKGTDMNKAIQSMMLLLLAAGVTAGAEAKSATLLLQEGIYAEETEGNLDKAIGIYQEAAKAAGESEKAAAEAVFRTGMCYLKKGNKSEAAKQFQLVLTKYASQTAIAAEATSQLQAMGKTKYPEIPDEVMEYLVKLHRQTYADAHAAGIKSNSHVYFVNSQGHLYHGGLITYRNTGTKSVTGEVQLTHTSYPDQTLYNELGERLKTRVERSTGGRYKVMWTVDRPVEPNEMRLLAWLINETRPLGRAANGESSLTMENFFGSAVLENFFLVVPQGTVLSQNSAEPLSKATLAGFDVYQWQKKVPENTNNKVAVQLSMSSTPAAKPFEIGPVPWTDGEVCRLVIKTNTGMVVGDLDYMPHKSVLGGREVWVLDSYQIVTMQDMRQFTRVEADAATFTPIAGRTLNQLGDFVAAYDSDKVALSMTIKGKTTMKEIPVSGPVYDNEQALMLIRRLPLAEGYAMTFPIFSVQGGSVVDCTINVEGKEEVAVPFGTAECWKVKLAVFSGAIKALEHTLWFSADEHKRLMKYDAGTATMELVEVSKAAPQTIVSDGQSGVSFSLPYGWVACTDGAMGGYKLYWPIVNEGLETWCTFIAREKPAAEGDLNAIVDGDIQVLNGFLKNYTPRPDSRTEIKAGGLPAVRFAADYLGEDQKPMVEYRTYIMGKGLIYWFVFRTDKDKFEANKATYDGIVDSFSVASK